MSNVTYSAGNLTITVAGLDTVEQALGDLKRKTPAAAKVAINATARQARKLMVAKAKTRYAVNAAGRRHLKDLVQRKKASNSSLMAELHIAKMRNDLGYYFEGKQYTEIDLNGVADLNSLNESAAENRLTRAGFMVTDTSYNYLYACILAGMATGLPEEFFTGLPLYEVLKIKNAVNDAGFFE